MTDKHPLSMDVIFHEFWGTEPPEIENRRGMNFSYIFFEESCQMSYDKGYTQGFHEGHKEGIKTHSWMEKMSRVQPINLEDS